MTNFYVHWNAVVRKVRIHQSICGACKDGAGMHEGRIAQGRGDTYDWEPAKSYAEAVSIAERLMTERPILKKVGARVNCGLCRPAQNEI